MLRKYLKPSLISVLLVILTVISSLTLVIAPALATTIAFKTDGKAGNEGVLTGEVVFDQTAFQNALRKSQDKRDLSGFLPLDEIIGAKLTFRYVSPYSGIVHTEAQLCGKKIYDIGGYEKNPLAGGKDPMLLLSNGVPDSVDFSSCVGEEEGISSKVSSRDSRVVSSTTDALGGKFSVFDKDSMGNMLSKRIKTITYTQKIDSES